MEKEKHFVGTCNTQQLFRFSLGVVGFRFLGGLPRNIVMPASKNRRNCHVAFDVEGLVIQPAQVLKTHGINAGFFCDDIIYKARWISHRGNELIALREDNDVFSFSLIERTEDRCHYRKILEQNRIELTLKD